MSLTLEAILRCDGIDPGVIHATRSAFVREHVETGPPGNHADSTDAAILAYTSQ